LLSTRHDPRQVRFDLVETTQISEFLATTMDRKSLGLFDLLAFRHPAVVEINAAFGFLIFDDMTTQSHCNDLLCSEVGKTFDRFHDVFDGVVIAYWSFRLDLGTTANLAGRIAATITATDLLVKTLHKGNKLLFAWQFLVDDDDVVFEALWQLDDVG